MPCNQMISMNWSPPRAIAVSRAARLPAANARTRNSDSRNIGSATWVSTTQNTSNSTTPPISPARTQGLVQPVAWPP
ncbi:hypothetical protein STEPF1_05407 [Streptomyces sp. F-1]|nr:hypothetical protein STEPF1_05407 [Streptomyces sp. F-1]